MIENNNSLPENRDCHLNMSIFWMAGYIVYRMEGGSFTRYEWNWVNTISLAMSMLSRDLNLSPLYAEQLSNMHAVAMVCIYSEGGGLTRKVG